MLELDILAYGHHEKSENAFKIFNEIVKLGCSEKDASLSWIGLFSGAHVFSSGDQTQTHPEADELHTKLLSLQNNSRKPGEDIFD